MKIFCQQHPENEVFGVLHGKTVTKLICDECLVYIQIDHPTETIQQITDVSKALKEPSYLLRQITQKNFESDFDDIFLNKIEGIKKEFDERIKLLNITIQSTISEFYEYYEKIKLRYEQMHSVSKNTDQYKSFENYFTRLEVDQKNESLLKEIETGVNKIICDLKNLGNVQQMLYQISNCQNESYGQLNYSLVEQNKLQPHLNDIKEIQNKLIKLVKNQFSVRLVSPSIYCYSEFSQNRLFSNFNPNNITLLYHGGRDGLNSDKFWEKVTNQSNLLMIFKSQNGNVFGCYSPYQWLFSSSSQTKDQNYSSFIFSETQKTIYNKIKKEGYIYFNCNSWIVNFGQDLIIYNDFKTGSSKLGNQYRDESPGSKTNEAQNLFGGAIPDVVDCEVFKIY